VNFTLLYLFMTRVAGSLETVAMVSTLGRCLLASAPIAFIGWWSHSWLMSLNHGPVIARGGALTVVIAIAVLLFLTASWALKIEGFTEFLGILKRKLGARS
jgi:hypothetical protein